MASAKCWRHRHRHTDGIILMSVFGFSRVKVKDKIVPQLFVGFHEDGFQDNPVVMDSIIIKNTAAVVGTTRNGQVLKLIEPRRWHEVIKLLWGHSRINKEVYGNRLLRLLSIGTPNIYAYGIGVFPARNYRYVGYILMENLVDRGAVDASHLLFWDNKLSADIRARVYRNIASDLKIMRDHYVVFSDITLGNIMAYPDGSIAWIDTGVTRYGSIREGNFEEKYNGSIKRFVEITRSVMTVSEIALFEDLLF